MKKNLTKEKNIFLLFFAFVVSFCLSFSITSFSKMTTQLSGVQDSKTIAKWDVSANIPTANISLVPNEEDEYTLYVTNNSEVSSTYSITVSNIPNNTFVFYNGKSNSNGATSVTFNNVGTINANSSNKTNTHTIKIKAAPEATEVSNRKLNIQVVFNQKRPQ